MNRVAVWAAAISVVVSDVGMLMSGDNLVSTVQFGFGGVIGMLLWIVVQRDG